MWKFIKGLFKKEVKEEAPMHMGKPPIIQEDKRLDNAILRGNLLAEKIRREYEDRQAQFTAWKENNVQVMSYLQAV